MIKAEIKLPNFKTLTKFLKLPVFVIAMGGLGNQMFIVSTGLILANKKNRKIYIVNQWFKYKQRADFLIKFERAFELSKFPTIRKTLILNSNLLNYIIFSIYKFSIRVKKWFSLFGVCDLDIHPSSKKGSFIWYGNMHSDTNYEENRITLKTLFELDQKSEHEIFQSIQKFKRHGKELIAIHIRRGDTLVQGNISNVLPSSYFYECIKRFDLSKSLFLIFSDDIPWCKENFLGKEFFIIEETDPVISLRMMNYCDHYILSSSTFGWWGAWLTESKAPKIHYPKVLKLGTNTLIEAFHRPTWIGVETYFEVID
jgi:hypothetical protein